MDKMDYNFFMLIYNLIFIYDNMQVPVYLQQFKAPPIKLLDKALYPNQIPSAEDTLPL